MINLQHKIVSNYPTSEGETIRIDVRYEPKTNFAPLFFIAHGFKGYRNWGFLPFLARHLAKSGAIVVNFDFSLNGVASDIEPINYDVKSFARNTISHEVHDLSMVMDYVRKLPEVSKRINGEIHLAGHSRGGMIALLTANKRNTELDEIHSISLLNSIAKLDRYTEHQKEVWKNEGKMSFLLTGTTKEMHIDYKYLDEILRSYPTPRIHAFLQSLDFPVHIIHAEQDMTVKPEEGELLHSLIPHSSYYSIPGVGHDFGYKQNQNKPTPQLQAVAAILTKAILGK